MRQKLPAAANQRLRHACPPYVLGSITKSFCHTDWSATFANFFPAGPGIASATHCHHSRPRQKRRTNARQRTRSNAITPPFGPANSSVHQGAHTAVAHRHDLLGTQQPELPCEDGAASGQGVPAAIGGQECNLAPRARREGYEQPKEPHVSASSRTTDLSEAGTCFRKSTFRIVNCAW